MSKSNIPIQLLEENYFAIPVYNTMTVFKKKSILKRI